MKYNILLLLLFANFYNNILKLCDIDDTIGNLYSNAKYLIIFLKYIQYILGHIWDI